MMCRITFELHLDVEIHREHGKSFSACCFYLVGR